MDYVFELTVQPNTTKLSPASLSHKTPSGIVTQVRILFPSGCAGLVGIRIREREYQVWPTNTENWYRGDNTHIVFGESYEIDGDFTEIKIEGYNDDDFFAHTVIVAIHVEPKDDTWSYPASLNLGYQEVE